MAFTVVIPARYQSVRLPGKPLLDIAGQSMIQRVYQQASGSAATRVLVATDDQRIVEHVEGFGGQVLLTSTEHESGTERLHEVVAREQCDDDDIIVNVQGDEPLIPPEVIDQVAENLARHSDAALATLCEAVDDAAAIFDPNAVKVVRDHRQFALYFSRAPIPWDRDWSTHEQPVTLDGMQHEQQQAGWYRHIGLYAYRAATLRRFAALPPHPLERLERLEQLRALANGLPIHCAEAVTEVPGGIDTEADLAAARARFER